MICVCAYVSNFKHRVVKISILKIWSVSKFDYKIKRRSGDTMIGTLNFQNFQELKNFHIVLLSIILICLVYSSSHFWLILPYLYPLEASENLINENIGQNWFKNLKQCILVFAERTKPLHLSLYAEENWTS